MEAFLRGLLYFVGALSLGGWALLAVVVGFVGAVLARLDVVGGG